MRGRFSSLRMCSTPSMRTKERISSALASHSTLWSSAARPRRTYTRRARRSRSASESSGKQTRRFVSVTRRRFGMHHHSTHPTIRASRSRCPTVRKRSFLTSQIQPRAIHSFTFSSLPLISFGPLSAPCSVCSSTHTARERSKRCPQSDGSSQQRPFPNHP